MAAWLDLRQSLWPTCGVDDLVAEQAEIMANAASHFACLAFEGSNLIGFAEFSIRDWAEGCTTRDVDYVEAWYVMPEHRNRGIGRELLAAGEAWALERGASEIGSDVELANGVSQRAHERLGYREVQRVVAYAKRIRSEA